MAWLQAHWLTILTVWAAVNAVIIAPLSVQFPPTTWYGKLLHFVGALSPLDVLKAWKALGAELTPPPPVVGPMVVLLVACALGTSACASTAPAGQPTKTATVTIDQHALAAAADNLLWAGWKGATTACLAPHDEALRQKCEPILKPARDALLLADGAIDVWDSAAQKNFPCLVGSVVLAFSNFSNLSGVTVPQALKDGMTLAQTYAGRCSP